MSDKVIFMTNKEAQTITIGKRTITFDGTQTRGVLGGAYRAKDPRNFLTHLVFCLDGDNWVDTACRQPVSNTVDEYGAEDIDARPTCKTCAAKWDKIHGKKAA